MGKTIISIVPYAGWTQALRLANAEVELIATLEVGPRILHYAHHGGQNVLKEIPAQLGRSGEPEWKMRGGHRLWTAPEDPAHTYSADNGPTQHHIGEAHAVITTPTAPQTGLEKSLRLSLDDDSSQVHLLHTIANRGSSTFELAPWALSVLAPGGTAIIPLPPYAPHPGDGAANAALYAPQLTVSFWSYFRFTDPRFEWGNRFIRITQDPNAKGPAKIGAALAAGWAAYNLGETLFVKRFSFDPAAIYPDHGCNFETYTDAGILELESLAPLNKLEPGQSVTHSETWSLHTGFVMPEGEDDLASLLEPLGLGT